MHSFTIFILKAVSKEMGHASEIITVDVYGDKEEMILTGVKEIEEYIKEVISRGQKNNDLENDSTSITAINKLPYYLYKKINL